MLYPVLKDAIVAAFDKDELQFGIHLTGEIPPLGTGGLWSVNGIDNDIVPKSELLSGQGCHNEVRSVVCRRGLADPPRHIVATSAQLAQTLMRP